NSYIEITNGQISIWKRDGTPIAATTLFGLFGKSVIGDPMAIWDPDTQRFYVNSIGPAGEVMDWGFSKGPNPKVIPGDFCTYESSFNLPQGLADYPKLGQTKGFLAIGINFYPPGSEAATEGDVLWVNKPQGSSKLTTCPDPSKF